MACTISITSVIGVPVSGTSTNVTVSGTVSGCASNKVTVTIGCGGGVGGSATVLVTGGNWTATILTNCLCNQPMNITATCTSDPTCTVTISQTLICNCCPSTSVAVTNIGNCDSQGNRPVIFLVTNC